MWKSMVFQLARGLAVLEAAIRTPRGYRRAAMETKSSPWNTAYNRTILVDCTVDATGGMVYVPAFQIALVRASDPDGDEKYTSCDCTSVERARRAITHLLHEVVREWAARVGEQRLIDQAYAWHQHASRVTGDQVSHFEELARIAIDELSARRAA